MYCAKLAGDMCEICGIVRKMRRAGIEQHLALSTPPSPPGNKLPPHSYQHIACDQPCHARRKPPCRTICEIVHRRLGKAMWCNQNVWNMVGRRSIMEAMARTPLLTDNCGFPRYRCRCHRALNPSRQAPLKAAFHILTPCQEL